MYLDAAKKQEIFGKYGKSNTDTGSVESQVALFSYRIARLTEHMKLNRKDYSTERALTMLVGKRRALLDYLKARDIERYRALVKNSACVSNLPCGKRLKEWGNFFRSFPTLLFHSSSPIPPNKYIGIRQVHVYILQVPLYNRQVDVYTSHL